MFGSLATPPVQPLAGPRSSPAAGKFPDPKDVRIVRQIPFRFQGMLQRSGARRFPILTSEGGVVGCCVASEARLTYNPIDQHFDDFGLIR
jgi:hypothetical protein